MKTQAFILGLPNESKISLTTDDIFKLPVLNSFCLTIGVTIPPTTIAGENFHNAYWIKAFISFFKNNHCEGVTACKIVDSNPDAVGGTIVSCEICESDLASLNYKLSKWLILLREFKRQNALEHVTVSIDGKELQFDIQIE
ncbi:hypothetical protein CHRY9390_01584 [Chryseobacterium aquaeductus]|uniref:Uncharacterized protein n=1 Tax=Chryseobacterium aquaeductus TaxID=2675056 RepID=A0A9N8MG38_9FLAO|nr:hypothetical protein [Chryseobacterium aquaeductus]CAA7330905.1 hypothetical protein CHRY9390_01584 [Chryseobacterium potabilaquae]CAD7806913.1 hypothetical protein CHRY9390_01584 [Chryseobacterium aquaeductus]